MMNIIVVTNDGVNIASPFSINIRYKLFELGRNEFNLKSKTISDLVSKAEEFSSFISETKLFELLSVNKRKTVFITNILSPHLISQLRDFGVETYITFKKSINEALSQYYSDWLLSENLFMKNSATNQENEITY